MFSTAANTPTKAPRESLQRRLIAVFLACIGLPAIITGAFFIWSNYQKTVDKDSTATAQSYADFLQAGLAVALWNLSPDLGEPLLESVMVDKSVLAVTVLDDEQKVFLRRAREGFEAEADDAMILSRPVEYRGTSLGNLELAYSLTRAQNQATNEAELLALIVVVQLLFSLVPISWVLHRRVLSPLRQLERAASGITGGDLQSSMPRLRHDEFGELAERLEEMRGALERSFRDLEERVHERTQQLQGANQSLRETLEQLETTQDNLIQSEKLAALGALVAGIAHELNTPIGNGLTVSSSMRESCERMQQQMQQGLTRSALHQYMADMEEGARLVFGNLEKASELVRGFKQAAMDRTSAQRRRFSLLSMLEETRLTLSPTLKRTPYNVDIQVEQDIELDSYPGPLGQVVTNLLNNAVIHAFDGRDHGEISITGRRLGNAVELTVADDGRGIAYEHQPKVFDPFFTTKLGAGGNGLGMHIVHNIVTGVLGGNIRLRSVPGEGTKFTINLPLSAPENDESAPADGRPMAAA